LTKNYIKKNLSQHHYVGRDYNLLALILIYLVKAFQTFVLSLVGSSTISIRVVIFFVNVGIGMGLLFLYLGVRFPFEWSPVFVYFYIS